MPTTDTELDVRSEPPARRHELIFDTYHDLQRGTGFVLVNDHERGLDPDRHARLAAVPARDAPLRRRDDP